ncbi:hypothetical protein R6Q59_008869 [Mikania micrantha]
MAASSSSSTKVSLKLLIDVKSKKVLFAEASKEFVDFLFHILSLPVGTVIKLLRKNSMVGSLGNLYDSIENLSSTYMQPNQSKDVILNPKIANYGAHVPLLSLNADDSMNRKFYKCGSSHVYVADDPTALCPQCKYQMSTELTYVAGESAAKEAAEGGGFVKGVVTYMVMDDLVVKPMSTISSIAMLNKFNVKEVGGLEEKVVSLEMKEGLMLLKASLQCKNVLTICYVGDYINGNRHKNIALNPNNMNKTTYRNSNLTAMCAQCNHKMRIEVAYVAGNGAAKVMADGGCFVKRVVTYMVLYMAMDDLVFWWLSLCPQPHSILYHHLVHVE